MEQKLLLINPTSNNSITTLPPLGLGYIAALTPDDWDIELIDENIEKFSYKSAHLVAITAMTSQINRAYEIALVYKQEGIPVILGGIHPSMMPDEALNYVDTVVIGEVEGIWKRVISDFKNGTLNKIYKAKFIQLKGLPFPRRDLFNSRYKLATILTSRGCPFNCDFCSVTAFNGKKYRHRPINEVIKELKTIKKKVILFLDDNIVGAGRQNEKRTIDLVEAMIKNKIRKKWFAQASVNIINNKRLLKSMSKSGCRGLLIGFESIKIQSLKKMNKNHNISSSTPSDNYKNVIKILHKYKMIVCGFFIFGRDEDTIESIRDTIKFIKNSNIDLPRLPYSTPLPGTTFYSKIKKRINDNKYPSDWDKYNLRNLVYQPKNISKDACCQYIDYQNKRLYTTFSIIKRSIKSFISTKSIFCAKSTLLIGFSARPR